MQATFHSAELAMRRGQSLQLADTCESRITGVRGAVWLTHEGDQDDHIIEPGKSFEVPRGDRLWLFAMDESQVRIEQKPVAEEQGPALRIARHLQAAYLHLQRLARRRFEAQRETSLAY